MQNPLIRIREERGLTRPKWATLLGRGPSFIRFLELGCYEKIPTCYAPYVTAQDRLDYQEFRRQKRLKNFSPEMFPAEAESMQDVLDHLGMTYTQFALAACCQPGEVFRVTTRDRNLLPHNLHQFFEQIGLSKEWIANLKYVTIRQGTHTTHTTLSPKRRTS